MHARWSYFRCYDLVLNQRLLRCRSMALVDDNRINYELAVDLITLIAEDDTATGTPMS